MGKLIADYDENKYINSLVENCPDKTGWIYKDDTDDWYYLITDKDSATKDKWYKNKIVYLEPYNTYNYFNEFGRCVEDIFVIGNVDEDNDEFLVSKIISPSEISLGDFSMCDVRYSFSKGKEGLLTGRHEIELSDAPYTFVFDEKGRDVSNLTVDGILCVNGILANETMLQGPCKKYGYVFRNGLPYLCDTSGKLLNLQIGKFYDEEADIFIYVNTDRTFFFSKDAEDEKWY